MNKILGFVFVILISLSSSGYTQSYSRMLTAKLHPDIWSIYSNADSLKSYLDFDAADKAYTKAIGNAEDKFVKAYGLLGKADNFIRCRKTEAALKVLNQLKIQKLNPSPEFEADETYLWALYYYQIGQYDTSLLLFEKVEKTLSKLKPNPLYLGEFLNNYGEVFTYGKINYVLALKYFEKSKNIWESQNDLCHFNLGRIYYNLGNIYGRRSEYSLSLSYGTKALEIANRFAPKYPRLEFGCYALFSEAFSILGKYRESILWSKKQLNFALQNNLQDDLLIYAYNDISESCRWNNDFQEALFYNNLLFNILVSKNTNASRIYPLALRRQAVCLEKTDQIGQAELFHKKSITANASYYGTTSRRFGQALRNLAEFLINQSRYNEAILAIDSSITTYEYNWVKNKDESFLYGIILGFFQQGLIRQKALKSDEDVLQSFLSAAYYMDSARSSYYVEETELNLSSIIKPIYENIIRTAFELYNETKDSTYFEYIYYAIESNKYQTLWEKIEERNYFDLNHIPQLIMDSITHIESTIARLSKNMQEQLGNSAENQILIAELKLKKKRIFASNDLKKEVNDKNNSLKVIQSVLKIPEFIIELFEGDSICYGLIIQNRNCQFFQFNLDSKYLEALDSFKQIISGSELDIIKSQQIKNYLKYTTIISAPFNDVLTNLFTGLNSKNSCTIIPDGVFSYLPFEAFLLNNKDQTQFHSFSELPYFIEKININYSISAKLLLQNRLNSSALIVKNITAIGPNKSAILPSAEQEIENISKQYGKNCKKVMFGQVDFLKHQNMNNTLLHIASHAIIDTNSNLMSYLQFGATEEDSSRLYDYEITNLKIKIPLVVLNACETFKGKLYKGEGVYNFSQSFLLGGSESAISTLWKIEDRSASKFMEEFYGAFKKGQTINESVNVTKRIMLEDNRSAHPFFWAAYLYSGESMATYQTVLLTPFMVYLIFGSLLLLLLISWVIYKRSV